jgi:hypothetical protein
VLFTGGPRNNTVTLCLSSISFFFSHILPMASLSSVQGGSGCGTCGGKSSGWRGDGE